MHVQTQLTQIPDFSSVLIILLTSKRMSVTEINTFSYFWYCQTCYIRHNILSYHYKPFFFNFHDILTLKRVYRRFETESIGVSQCILSIYIIIYLYLLDNPISGITIPMVKGQCPPENLEITVSNAKVFFLVIRPRLQQA